MKICPVCNSRCFDDMDTCYGCLHRFTEDDTKNETQYNNSSDEVLIPEYFETETFVDIQEDTNVVTHGAHAKEPCIKDEKIKVKIEIPKSVLKKYIV